MSWSNSWMGKPSAIKAAIGRYAATLTGLSKEEFDEARRHLEALLDQNSNKEKEPIVSLEANGHAYVKDGERQYSACSVTLKTIGTLVE
jgi:outer membrane protein assembly factor BamD (BamD/ComL family)